MKTLITRLKGIFRPVDEQTRISMIENYSQLPIGKYEEILTICKGKINEDAIEQQLAILSVLTDRSEDELSNLPLAEYSDLARRMRFLYAEDKGRHRIARSYKVGDMVLIPRMDLDKITTAQYIDFQTYAKGGEANIVQMLSCFLVPQGCNYNTGYDMVEVQKVIREHLSVTDVFSLAAFFFKQYRELMRSSLTYLTRNAKKFPKEIQERIASLKEQISKANGDGLRI